MRLVSYLVLIVGITPALAVDAPIKLNAPLVASGDVSDHVGSADGAWVVYRADQEVDGRDELYAVPAGGGPVVKLNLTPVADGDVLDYAIGPGATPRVVYRADQETDGRFDLYSVPITGGAPVTLNPAASPSVDTGYSISPDGSHVTFRTVSPRSLYVVPIDGGAAQLLSSVSPTTATFSPDGTRLAFQTGSTLRSLRTSTLAGSTTLLDSGTTAQQGFSHWTFSPDGSRLVYRFYDFGPLTEAIRSVDLTGGAGITHGSVGFGQTFLHGVSEIEVGGDYRVVFTINDGSSGRVRSAPLNGAGSLLLLTDPFVLDTVRISGDSMNVVANGASLWSIPILDGAPVNLNASVAGSVVEVDTTPDGQTVIFRAVDAGKFELYANGIGGGTAVTLNDVVGADRDVLEFDIGPHDTPVVYRADHGTADDVFDLFAVSTAGGAPLQLTTMPASGDVTGDWSWTGDGIRIVYQADGDADGQVEVYSVFDDSFCSVPAVFDLTVTAGSPDLLSWGAPRDVDWIVGDLGAVAVYGVLDAGSLSSATVLDISGALTVGAGRYFLIRPSTCGGWQSSPGAEPGRDASIP